MLHMSFYGAAAMDTNNLDKSSQNSVGTIDARVVNVHSGNPGRSGHSGHLGAPHAPTTEKPFSGAPCEQGSGGVSNPAPIQHVIVLTD